MAVVALPAAAHSALKSEPESLCFESGPATYRISHRAAAPDYRIRIDNSAAQPDLRMQLVDRPDIADFVIADDFGAADGSACRSSLPVKTVKIDAETRVPDVTVAISADVEAPDYRIYVHSVRFSHQDAAALLAVIWKASKTRKLAQRR